MEVLHPYKILSFARLLDFSRWMNNNDNNKLENFSSSSFSSALSFLSLNFAMLSNVAFISNFPIRFPLLLFIWFQVNSVKDEEHEQEKKKLVKTFYELFYGQNWARKKSLGETQMLNQIAREFTYL